MEAARGKGSVTSLSSMFPAEEAQKACRRVQETITEKRKELDTLHRFIADNTNLVNLVQRLPDELHHQIMVPFGKAAFFPGRLVHTNEFMVLLGEGYYAERTAKQTVDILTRRGKTLDSHVDSLKAVIKDLKTEALFFDRTAAEAEEGLVEIREEYTDEDSVETDSISGQQRLDAPRSSEEDSGAGAVDDEEYASIMSRFDELEREELEAGDNSEADEHGNTEEQEDDEHGEPEEIENDEHDESSDKLHHYQEHGTVQPHAEELSDTSQHNDAYKLHLGNLNLRSKGGDESPHGGELIQTEAPKPSQKDYVPSSILKTGFQSSPKTKQVSFQIPGAGGGSRIVGLVTEGLKAPAQMPKSDGSSRQSRQKLSTDSLKAFSGTIVERTDNLPLNAEKQTTSQPSNSQSSRPVSRFMMQRRAQGLS